MGVLFVGWFFIFVLNAFLDGVLSLFYDLYHHNGARALNVKIR